MRALPGEARKKCLTLFVFDLMVNKHKVKENWTLHLAQCKSCSLKLQQYKINGGTESKASPSGSPSTSDPIDPALETLP